MALTLGHTKLKVHPLALLAPALAALLGAREEVAALVVALAVHEAAHLLAGRALGVGVGTLKLMPFGGAIQLENPYAISPTKLLAVAAAGPAGSLLALLTAAALAHWRALPALFSLNLINVNLALLLFNLLPALPLDGGRMLYALLSEKLGRARAVEVGIVLGRVVAALLAALAAGMALALGRLNLSPVFAAVFILASAKDERRALAGANVKALLGELAPIVKPVPARVWAVGGDCPARVALRAARADALTLYAVYENSRPVRFTDDRRLLEAIIAHEEDVRMAELTAGDDSLFTEA